MFVWFKINVRENRKGNHDWTIHKNMQDCAQNTERRHKNQANKTTHTHKIRGEPKFSRMVSSSCYYSTPAVQLIVKSKYKNIVGERRKSKNYIKWKRFIAIWEMNIS